MTNNPGKRITLYHVASLFGKAYERSATMSIAINGFKESGIHPFNPDIFNDFDFMAADRLLKTKYQTNQKNDIELQVLQLAVGNLISQMKCYLLVLILPKIFCKFLS
jgi:hypothetical protein